MKYIFPAVCIAATLLLPACGGKQNPLASETPDVKEIAIENKQVYKTEDKEAYTVNEFEADTSGTRQAGPATLQKQPTEPEKQDWDKKIIKTALLNLEVKDHKTYAKSLREKVKNLGGYIAQEEQNQSDYKIETSLSIKVPVDQFDNAIVQLTDGVEKLNEKKITSQDVTAEYVDTRSRMEAKKQVRQRYMDLLRQAKNMEEILSVQNEIDGIQEQIESGLGRIQYLGHSAAYSTINLAYAQILNDAAKDKDQPSFATKTGNAFRSGWNFIAQLFIGLVAIWPLYLLALGIVFLYKRWKGQKPKAAI